MAKYKVLKGFRDIHTKEKYEQNTEIELTVKRADEASENLKEHGVFLERLDVPEEPKEEPKEEAPKGKK